MIDVEQVKLFWKTRTDKYNKLSFESIANLEESPELLSLKINLEQQCILPLLSLEPSMHVLDLGAGVGQWTFRFAPLVKHVTAVEYMDELNTIGKLEAKKRNLHNITFVTSPAEEFNPDQKFDLIFISGLLVYLNEEQVATLMSHLPHLLSAKGTLLLRDGTSILGRTHYINNQYSSILKEHYSAIYRTRENYISIFREAGFHLLQDGQVFEEGCPLNKFMETRLRYYQFLLGS